MKIILLLIILLFISSVYAKICPEGEYLVQGHQRHAYYRSDGTHVSASNVMSYCRNYRDDGPLRQQFKVKTPPKWPHEKEEFKKCSFIKQKQILKILNSIPKILINIGKLKIYCAKKSETLYNPATSAPKEKIIVLYNSSFKMNTKRIIVHELSHLLWSRLSDKEIESYYKVSKWVDLGGLYIYNRTFFSAPDEKNSPEEDFANNVEYYLAEPKAFKRKFPKIHLWIDKFIRGKK